MKNRKIAISRNGHEILRMMTHVQLFTLITLSTVKILVFESVHVRSLQIYEYFMVAINSTIFVMVQHALSHKIIFAVLDV